MMNNYEQMNFISAARFPPGKPSAFLDTENYCTARPANKNGKSAQVFGLLENWNTVKDTENGVT